MTSGSGLGGLPQSFALNITGDADCGVYVHIPFCKSRCSYCAFCSTTDLRLMPDYIDALEREISTCGKPRTVDTVYIGGGTPSCLYDGTIMRIFKALRRAFDVSDCAEITVEVNPESCTPEFLRECRSCGVNRISMGLQSADDGVLRAVNRLHDYDGFINAAKLLRSVGFDNISTDFILGLPHQSVGDIEKCVQTAAEYCTHASVYALTVEENTPIHAAKYSPDDDKIADMYDLACRKLDIYGFKMYEVSNFARDGHISKHNSKYWRGAPYVGLGAAAHGYDGMRTRYANTSDIKAYISGERKQLIELTDRDLFNEFVMLGLRTERGISRAEFLRRFSCGIDEIAGDTIKSLSCGGLIIDDGENIRISSDKMFVMNGIIEEIML